MIGVIDTSSLVAIARYYLSIKDEIELLQFLESKFRSGKLVMLSTIYDEASKVQQGISLELMKFLKEKEFQVDDSMLLPPAPQRFNNQVDNNFCIPPLKKRLIEKVSENAYIQQKEKFMQSGDIRMILYQ
jgi:hypothetical protein